jgi:glutaredoxin-like protein NrdH
VLKLDIYEKEDKALNKIHVDGKDRGDILIYALSTCGWCRKTKNFLRSEGVGFDYIDVDLLESEDLRETMEALEKFNKSGSFPTIVFNDDVSIIGFNEAKIKELI